MNVASKSMRKTNPLGKAGVQDGVEARTRCCARKAWTRPPVVTCEGSARQDPGAWCVQERSPGQACEVVRGYLQLVRSKEKLLCARRRRRKRTYKVRFTLAAQWQRQKQRLEGRASTRPGRRRQIFEQSSLFPIGIGKRDDSGRKHRKVCRKRLGSA
eukprot:2001813-Pleurochrysis_carterae.AAC.2